jgi:hypothetical protein
MKSPKRHRKLPGKDPSSEENSSGPAQGSNSEKDEEGKFRPCGR